MASVRQILAFALLFATITGSFASVSGIPAPSCYVKSRKCCWTYQACGNIVKREKVVTPCPFKKCGFAVCKNECKFITIQVPKEVCEFVKEPAAKKTCKKVKVPGPVPKEYIWREVCTRDTVTKKVCKTIKVPKQKKVCDKVCSADCKIIKAVCTKFGIYHIPKYCSRRSCDAPTITGSTIRPKLYFGAKVFKKYTKESRNPKW